MLFIKHIWKKSIPHFQSQVEVVHDQPLVAIHRTNYLSRIDSLHYYNYSIQRDEFLELHAQFEM